MKSLFADLLRALTHPAPDAGEMQSMPRKTRLLAAAHATAAPPAAPPTLSSAPAGAGATVVPFAEFTRRRQARQFARAA